MSLQSRLAALITAIKTETKAIRNFATGSDTGDASGLTTTATNLVAAINEVKVTADAASGGLVINDATPNTTEVYSSSKTEARLTEVQSAASADAAAQIVTALEGEDLSDIAASISALAAADMNLATAAQFTTLEATVNNKANTADIYTQTQLGDPETDLVALWNAA